MGRRDTKTVESIILKGIRSLVEDRRERDEKTSNSYTLHGPLHGRCQAALAACRCLRQLGNSHFDRQWYLFHPKEPVDNVGSSRSMVGRAMLASSSKVGLPDTTDSRYDLTRW